MLGLLVTRSTKKLSSPYLWRNAAAAALIINREFSSQSHPHNVLADTIDRSSDSFIQNRTKMESIMEQFHSRIRQVSFSHCMFDLILTIEI